MLAAMRRLIPFCLLLALLVCTVPAFAGDARVTDVLIQRGAVDTARTRFSLDIDRAVPYRAFVLNNPSRLVIDLPKMGWTAPLNKGDRNGTIRAYRRGVYQKDTLRIVLDLNRPAIVSSHERQILVPGRKWRYSFDLAPVSIAEFNKAVRHVQTGGGAPETATNGVTVIPKNVLPREAPAKETAPKELSPKELSKTLPKATQTAEASPKHKPLIVIDAGHGGVDPGALATNGVYEKNITLATAREVKRILEAGGKYRVQLTRETDIFIKLPERVRIARRANADMFISLHADTIGRSAVHGASVYTLSDVASDVETAKLAARENAVDTLVNVDVGHVDADVADILIDLVTRDTMNQSKTLAETVVGLFKSSGINVLPQRPHRSAGFAVLKAPDIPSALIEMGFLSNKEEADLLASGPYRTKLATAIARVIDRFYTETSKMAAY